MNLKSVSPDAITENLAIASDGRITGGSGTVIIDPAGEVYYSGVVTYCMWFVHGSQTVPQASYPVPPADLQSSFLTAVGQTITFGPVILTVLSLSPGVATMSINVQGQNISGTAVLDTSGPVIQLQSASVNATVPVLGDVTINVQKSS